MAISQLANHRAVLKWTEANQTFSGLEITMPPLSRRRITMSVCKGRTLWSIQAHYHQPGYPRQPVKNTPMSFQNIQGTQVKLSVEIIVCDYWFSLSLPLSLSLLHSPLKVVSVVQPSLHSGNYWWTRIFQNFKVHVILLALML
jgi:hypothetical protein